MAQRMKCPSCGRVKTVSRADAGNAVMCAACGTRFSVPSLPPGILNLPAVIPDTIDEAPLHQERSHNWLLPGLAIGAAMMVLLGGMFVGWLTETPTKSPVVSSTTFPTTASRSQEEAVAPTPAPDWQAPIRSEPPTQPALTTLVPPSDHGLNHTTAPTAEVMQPATAPTEELVTRATTEPVAVAGPADATAPQSAPATEPSNTAIATNNLVPPTAPAPTSQPSGRVRAVPPQTMVQSLDDDIGQAISRGVAYLLSQFKDGRLQTDFGAHDDAFSGADALAVYALLHAGEATQDDRLGPHTPLVDALLKVLKQLPMDHGKATYARALRAAALAVYDRGEDRTALRADTAWLLKAASNGAYTYEIPQSVFRSTRFSIWDNSNSQYGALGVWAAADVGGEVPLSYWGQVREHWLNSQLRSGEWSYSDRDEFGRLSMTVAGITTLFVTEDQIHYATGARDLGKPPFIPALARGLKWLETGDNAITLPFSWRSYNLYGLERAALASGFKYFGTHDWYRELAKDALVAQRPDGSWTGEQEVVDTSFTLLFLSRGRHPVFMNKLRFDGFWANHPRDVATLCRYATRELERPVNWQVVGLSNEWTDWMDSPVLYISSHEPPVFADEEIAKLRSFALAGGLIFTEADGDSPAFNRFVETLSQRLFPDYPLENLPTTHDIYSSLFKLNVASKPDPAGRSASASIAAAASVLPLKGVSNGSRLLLVHSPTDLGKSWQMRDWKYQPAPYELGLNVFIYAAGKANLRNKLRTPYVPAPAVEPIAAIAVARLRYPGNWDPEPAAWERFSRLFLGQTSIALNVNTVDLIALDAKTAAVAHLTGTAAVSFTDADISAVRKYVDAGGVLLIDSCGGSTEFAQSIRADLLARAFPSAEIKTLGDDHPILSGEGLVGTRVMLRLRAHAAELLGTPSLPLNILTSGSGGVLLSGVDLTSGLVGTNNYGVIGYTPETAESITRNTLLWALSR